MTLFEKKILIEAVKKYDTPLYLYHGEKIRHNYRYLRKIMPQQMAIYYSMKANPLLGICELLQKEGACCEVCSEIELSIALKAGFPPNKIIFVGPGKNEQELKLCIKAQIYAVVCESLDEVLLLNAIAKKYHVKASILLRINPIFKVKTAPLKMGGQATQFGFDLSLLNEQISRIMACQQINIIGIHIYNGTRILDSASIIENTRHILNLADELQQQWSLNFKCIDIGGGLGIPYFNQESELDIRHVGMGIRRLVKRYLKKHEHTTFILESGRYLIGHYGVLIAKIRSIKISHQEEFIITDAGMNCHMAATGIGSFVRRNFPISCHSYHEHETDKKKIYNITGPLCTPGDILATKISLPIVQQGDLIMINNSGAYGSSASPGRFLSHGFPSEVIYDRNEFHLLKKRETIADLLSTQINLTNKKGFKNVY